MSYLIFTDQKSFMRYFDQGASPDTVALYRKLIAEEDKETNDALDAYDLNPTPETITEVADGLLDGIYVRIGLLHGLGLDPQALWDEVQRSNIDKLKHPCGACEGTGTVSREPETGDPTDVVRCETCNGQSHVYRVKRRDDGKVLKPDGWTPPNLLPLVMAMLKKEGEE